jgi:hypothetical protein
LFPYNVIPQVSRRVVIRTSRLSFRTNFLPFRQETIERISVYMALVRDRKAVSNILRADMKTVHVETWRPITFHEFDWIVDSSAEVSFYAEVVASVRIYSPSKPYAIKETLLAHGSVEFVTYVKGSMQPAATGKVRLSLRRPEEVPLDHETWLTFHLSHPRDKYLGLQDDFACPSQAVCAYESAKNYLLRVMSPFASDFGTWSEQYLPFILFKEIALNDRALNALLNGWPSKAPQNLVMTIFKFFPATRVLAKGGLYIMGPHADSVERATDRVAAHLENGKMAADERIKPFHTDELRTPFVLSVGKFFD